MSQIPYVASFLQRIFDSSEVTLLDRPQESVAQGLTLIDEFDNLNIHRPSFHLDAVLSGDGLSTPIRQRLYTAFDPIYQTWESQTGAALRVHREIPYPLGCHGAVTVKLEAVSVGGKKVELRYENKVGTPWIRLHRGSAQLARFSLYADGRILLIGPGQRREFRIDRWPILRSTGYIVPVSTPTRITKSDEQVGQWWGERP
jgi:hypothetical protein